MSRPALPSALLYLVLAASLVTAALAAEPFDVRADGNFTRMAHTGDARGVVALADLGGQAGTYGVGAPAALDSGQAARLAIRVDVGSPRPGHGSPA
ncbi:MAG: hypothetical protein M5U08_02880 [Burkholderiales bacterium]|nr:hypothetical protein [Burkholderiales bacterium]